jgi:tetratricopeptide (TPR) repeat protein
MNLSRKEILSLIEKSQNEYSLFYGVGKAYIAIGNYSGAKTYFLKALENNIVNIDIYSDIAWVSYQLNDFNDTIFYCGKYLQNVPQDTLCADLAALSAMRSGNLQLATDIYSQLVPDLRNRFIHALDDGAASAAGRGAYFKSINESDKAVEFFKMAINYSVAAAELAPSACRFYNIAKFNEQIGENETAKEYYQKAAELDPNFNLTCPNICFPLT